MLKLNDVQNQSTHSLHLNNETFIILKFELSLKSVSSFYEGSNFKHLLNT